MIPEDHLGSLALTLKGWLKQFPRKQLDVPSLSHYTSAEGLLGICSTNSIWATLAQYSNDLSERNYSQAIAGEVLQEFCANRRFTKSGEFVKSFLELHLGRKDRDPMDAYITSFCESSDLLSQWRAYGSRAGFEIRFDSLTKKNDATNSDQFVVGSRAVNRINIVKIQYEPATQKQMLLELLQGTFDVLERLEGENPIVQFIDVGIASFAALEAITWLYTVKHPSFSEEKEWRIVAFPDTETKAFSFFTRSYKFPEDVRFRVGRHSLVPYLELKPLEGQLPICKVVCGPGGHHKLTSKAVEMLVEGRGFKNVSVHNSSVPLAL